MGEGVLSNIREATTTIISSDFSTSNNYAEKDGIRPGDVIIIYHDNSSQFNDYGVWLDHVTMYVDGGILSLARALVSFNIMIGYYLLYPFIYTGWQALWYRHDFVFFQYCAKEQLFV